jgi:23S rRNA pseudouridine2605 synthase
MGAGASRHGLARVISKLGICSRTRATALIRAARVSVNGQVELDPEHPTDARRDRIGIDGMQVDAADRIYIALNKPRGTIVSAADERDRDTVYTLLGTSGLPWLAPVGRLDKASEGLLLMSNDPEWAAHIADPAGHVPKTYHVQIAGLPDRALLDAIVTGMDVDDERLAALSVRLLRAGGKNAWLEVVLDEGRNRHIRRLLAALGFEVLRLVRIAIGPVVLGELPKKGWRHLSDSEVHALASRRPD